MHADASLSALLEERLLELISECRRMKVECPHIIGIGQFRRRLQKELDFLEKFRDGSCTGDALADLGPGLDAAGSLINEALLDQLLIPAQLQGVWNNVRGLGAELEVARHAPGVVGISRRFWSIPAPLVSANEDVSEGEEPPAGAAACEVDVVAQGGHAWIEVKSHRPFGVYSQHWLGSSGHTKGLRQQAIEQLAIAAAPCNALRWRPPSVVFHFVHGASPDVAAELHAMGITVTGPALVTAEQLPPVPPPPSAVNLDVTTLCALVSEVTNSDPRRPDMVQWASRTSHWRECLAAEAEAPLHASLASRLSSQQLYVAASALRQFEKLMSTLAGPSETARWKALRQHLHVVDVDMPQPAPSGATASAAAVSAAALEQTGSSVVEHMQPGADSAAVPAPPGSHSSNGKQPCSPPPKDGSQWRRRQQQQQHADWALHAICSAKATQPSQPTGPSANGATPKDCNGSTAASDSSSSAGSNDDGVAHSGCSSVGQSTADAIEAAAVANGGEAQPSSAVSTVWRPPECVSVASSRMAGLQRMTPEVKAMFAVGDAAQAVTLTANARAVAAAAWQGVHLEAHVHRAVWLTGF